MCLVLVAWDCHPKYQVILAGNRDEYHHRPTAALDWWDDAPGLLAGRDLQAGGTWMAVGAGGRFGALANYYLAEAPPPEGLRSRGELVPSWITGKKSLDAHTRRVAAGGREYGGFNCLLGDAGGLYLVSNCDPEPLRALPPGIHGLSNDLFERPWAKVTSSCRRLEAILSDPGEIDPESLLALLAVSGSQIANVEKTDAQDRLAARRQTPMVVDNIHGTRSTTAILIARDGKTSVVERRFDASGNAIGKNEFRFSVATCARSMNR